MPLHRSIGKHGIFSSSIGIEFGNGNGICISGVQEAVLKIGIEATIARIITVLVVEVAVV